MLCSKILVFENRSCYSFSGVVLQDHSAGLLSFALDVSMR